MKSKPEISQHLYFKLRDAVVFFSFALCLCAQERSQSQNEEFVETSGFLFLSAFMNRCSLYEYMLSSLRFQFSKVCKYIPNSKHITGLTDFNKSTQIYKCGLDFLASHRMGI